jgi:hypothetical protein
MRTVELLIDEEQDDFGVEAISLVKFPAIEENFVYFNKDQKLTLAKVDEDKKLLIGPALIPEKMIPRWDDVKQEEFEVYFSKETVQQAAELFMRQKRNGEYTVEHQTKVDGLSIFESWIVADKDRDKAAVYGFDVPDGTWMVSVRVHNGEVWNDVKDKKYRGFSIEGYFIDKLIKMEDITIETIAAAARDVLEPIAFLDGKPLFGTPLEAELMASALGCEGHHPHEVNGQKMFMPCETHEQLDPETQGGRQVCRRGRASGPLRRSPPQRRACCCHRSRSVQRGSLRPRHERGWRGRPPGSWRIRIVRRWQVERRR